MHYLIEGEGVIQYNWLWQPNCTEPGPQWYHPDSPSFYNRTNGVKIHRFKWETEPVDLERIIEQKDQYIQHLRPL